MGLMLTARTATRTSPGPAFGSGKSSYFRFDGGPYSCRTAAFIKSPRLVRCADLTVQVLAPLVALCKSFEQVKAAMQQALDVGRDDGSADEASAPAEFHGEAYFVVQAGTFRSFGEAMVVLEAAKAAGDHAVLEEVWRVPGLGHDERNVMVGEAKLHALPADRV